MSGNSNVEIGKFDYFTANLSIAESRSSGVTIIASSSSLDNNPITVCSIHILVSKDLSST